MDFNPFLKSLETSKRYSSQTVAAYRSDLQLFRAFLGRTSVTRVTQIDHKVINAYVDHMRGKPNPRFGRTGLCEASIARRLAAVSRWLDYCRAYESPELLNPIRDMTGRWQKNRAPKPVDELTLELLITGIDNLRDRTLFTLFLATGLRISEMHQLNRDSIQIEADDLESECGYGVHDRVHACGSGQVVGKGSKRRAFYVDEDSLILYSEYLEARTDQNPALFLSQRKTRMSVRAMQYTLASWCKRLGAPHINVHRLRHSYATRLANANISTLVLKDLMGHASFSTTQQYFKLTDQTLARGYFSAMEQVRK